MTAIQRYLKHLRYSNRSKVTIEKTRYTLEEFQNFIGSFKVGRAKLIRLIKQYKIFLMDRNNRHTKTGDRLLKPSSVRTMLFTVIGFLRWMGKPIPLDVNIEVKRGLPKYLRQKELDNLRRQIDRLSLKNRNIIHCMLFMAMRLSEVVNLKMVDLDLRNKTAIVIGKGGVIRAIMIPKPMIKDLSNWLSRRKKFHPVKGADRLFVKRWRGLNGYGPIYPSYVQRLLKTIAKNLNPHRLRHTFATYSVLNGVPLNVVQEILGHSNISTTSIYTKVAGTEQKIAMQMVNKWWK